jgi:hypothetical protein
MTVRRDTFALPTTDEGSDATQHKTLGALLAYRVDMLSLMALNKLGDFVNPFAESHVPESQLGARPAFEETEHALVGRARTTIAQLWPHGDFHQPLEALFYLDTLTKDFGGVSFSHTPADFDAYEAACRNVSLFKREVDSNVLANAVRARVLGGSLLDDTFFAD